MNQIIAKFLILLIFSMHSAWAISVHIDSEHDIDLSSHMTDHQPEAENTLSESDSDKSCNEHHCHISSHATALFSLFSLMLTPSQQVIDSTVIPSRYLYSQTTPQRPPKA